MGMAGHARGIFVTLIALILPLGTVIIGTLTKTLSDGMLLSNFTLAHVLSVGDATSPALSALTKANVNSDSVK